MKKQFLFIGALILSLNMSAQNWWPIISSNSYHYSCDTTQMIFTLKADSFQTGTNDTTYYLNRIVVPCDTCVNVTSYWSCNYPEIALLKNQPQILQFNCNINDTSIWSYGPGSFVIYQKKAQGETWLYDTLNNITATVAARTTGLVFGVNDSILTITLSSGDSIEISENYGILKFPIGTNQGYFRLYGIEGHTNIGEKMAVFKDYFNFNIGDYFVYYIKLMEPEAPTNNTRTWHYEITSKTEYPDGYEYGISGWYCTHYETCVNPTNFTGNLCFRENSQCNANSTFGYGYNNQTDEECYYLSSFQLNSDQNNERYYYKRYKANGRTKMSSEPRSMCSLQPTGEYYHSDLLTTYSNLDTAGIFCSFSNPAPLNVFIATEGIGVEKRLYCYFEQYYCLEAQLVVIQGDTLINRMLVNAPLTNNFNKFPALSPNPAEESFKIFHGEEYNVARIYDMTGKLILETVLSNEPETSVNVSGFMPGLYYVVLDGKTQSKSLKLAVY